MEDSDHSSLCHRTMPNRDSPELLSIYVGATFHSFAEFQIALTEFMQKTSTVYTILQSKCLPNQPTISPIRKYNKLPFPSRLKYQHAKFGCKHFGPMRSAGRGIRPNQRSFKTECPSYISICANRSQAVLYVKHAVLEHNHYLGPELAFLYPENRRVKSESGERKLLRMKKRPLDFDHSLSAKLQPRSPPCVGGKVLRKPALKTPKKELGEALTMLMDSPTDFCEGALDLPEVLSRLEGDEASHVGLDDYTDTLEREFDCHVEVHRPDGVFQGLFLQDFTMRQCYVAFPEFLFLECTSMVLQNYTCLYLLAVEDSAGRGEVVAVGILSSDNEESLDWLLSTFKKHNDSCSQCRVVLSNVVGDHGDTLQKHFPTSKPLMNPAYCVKAWENDVPYGEAGITEEGKDLAHNLLHRALDATCTATYKQVFSEMKSALPPEVFVYYKTNWHSIRDQWVLGITFRPNFMESTWKLTKRLKRKLALTFSASSVSVFFHRLFAELKVQRTERNKISNIHMSRVPLPTDQSYLNLVASQYSHVLTPYAASFVRKQLGLIDSCRSCDYMNLNGSSVTDGTVAVQVDTCCCPFYETMSLPCCHIFVRRRFLGIDLYDTRMCHKRWMKTYYIEARNQRVDESENETETDPLSPEHKLRQAFQVTSSLTTVLAGSEDDVFAPRLKFLKQLLEHWENGEEFAILEDMEVEELEDVTYDGRTASLPDESSDDVQEELLDQADVPSPENFEVTQTSPSSTEHENKVTAKKTT